MNLNLNLQGLGNMIGPNGQIHINPAQLQQNPQLLQQIMLQQQ